MANRNWRAPAQQVETGMITAHGIVSVGMNVSGTTGNTFPAGFVSGSRIAAGTIRVNTVDPYVAIRAVNVSLQNTGSQVLSAVISGTVGTTSSSYVDFLLVSGSNGAAVDPQNPVAFHVSLFLKNSSV